METVTLTLDVPTQQALLKAFLAAAVGDRADLLTADEYNMLRLNVVRMLPTYND